MGGDADAHARVLQQWAAFGAALPARPAADWAGAEQLIEAVRPALEASSAELRALLERSGVLLGWKDPLLCDLGVHRWLNNENAYSDWLAWVLEALKDAGAVLRVLGQPLTGSEGGEYEVVREVWLHKGHKSQQGRIDLLIELSEPRRVIGVEVKIGNRDYSKQKGYLASLQQPWRGGCGVLVDLREPENTYGFQFRSWREVSLALRRVIAARNEKGPVEAMVLAFVAAIEQKLLGMSSVIAMRSWQRHPIWVSRNYLDYLRRATEVDDARRSQG
jgi:hypothetical protein